MTAPLDVLRQKLGEAHGLAIAAAGSTAQVEARMPHAELRAGLRSLHEDALETRGRCLAVEAAFDDEVATQVLAHANVLAARASDLAVVWIKAGTDPIAALSFLAMGEAAEVATWIAVRELADRARDVEIAELAAWALPLQEQHLNFALQTSLELAASLDPLAPRFG